MRKRLCAYDNGNGLVVSEFVGDSVHAMDRIPGDKFKVVPPHKDLKSPEWEHQWEAQKNIVNDMVDAYNEKFKLINKGEKK